MTRLPDNSKLVFTSKPRMRHPKDSPGSWPGYRLIIFSTGIYALLADYGSIRTIDQRIARDLDLGDPEDLIV